MPPSLCTHTTTGPLCVRLALRSFVRREVREASPSLDANLAVSWMRLVGALLAPVMGERDPGGGGGLRERGAACRARCVYVCVGTDVGGGRTPALWRGSML